MYKTIRHGENSLQYTILPQHDDYSKGGGGGAVAVQMSLPCATQLGGPIKLVRHNKRRSCMGYLGLFFVISIISGAVLVPLLVSVKVLSGPKEWFYKRTAQGKAASSAIGSLLTISRVNTDGKPIFIQTADKPIQLSVPILEDHPMDEDALQSVSDDPRSAEQRFTFHPYMPSVVEHLLTKSENDASSNSVQQQDNASDEMAVDGMADTFATTSTSSTVAPLQTTSTTTTTMTTTKTSTAPMTTAASPGRKLRKPNIIRHHIIQATLTSLKLLGPAGTVDYGKISSIVIQPTRNDTKAYINKHWPKRGEWMVYRYFDNTHLLVISILMVITVAISLLYLWRENWFTCLSCRKKRVHVLTVEAQHGDNANLLTTEEEDEDECTEEE